MNFDNMGKIEIFKTEVDWKLGKITAYGRN